MGIDHTEIDSILSGSSEDSGDEAEETASNQEAGELEASSEEEEDDNGSDQLESDEEQGSDGNGGADFTRLTSSTLAAADRHDVSAATIGRMMGLATQSDLAMMEKKLDLVATKVNGMAARFEKLSSTLSRVATGGDLERIDVQIGALRTLLREFLGKEENKKK